MVFNYILECIKTTKAYPLISQTLSKIWGNNQTYVFLVYWKIVSLCKGLQKIPLTKTL